MALTWKVGLCCCPFHSVGEVPLKMFCRDLASLGSLTCFQGEEIGFSATIVFLFIYLVFQHINWKCIVGQVLGTQFFVHFWRIVEKCSCKSPAINFTNKFFCFFFHLQISGSWWLEKDHKFLDSAMQREAKTRKGESQACLFSELIFHA